MLDEEEIHLFPWLDPKNGGVRYTVEEAREWLGNSNWADQEIERLKEEGIVLRPVEENNEYLKNKTTNFKEELDLMAYEMYGKNKRIEELTNNNEGLTRDEILDKYTACILDESYDRRGYMMIEDMMSNIENISDFMNGDWSEMQGRFAKANQRIMEYSLSNLKSVYYYLSDSMIPAMEAVKNLSDTLRKREQLQKDIKTSEELLESKRNQRPWPYASMKTKETQVVDGKVKEFDKYITVNSIDLWRWEVEVQDMMQAIEDKKKELEKLSKEAEKYLKEVEKYEQENIQFTNFVDAML